MSRQVNITWDHRVHRGMSDLPPPSLPGRARSEQGTVHVVYHAASYVPNADEATNSSKVQYYLYPQDFLRKGHEPSCLFTRAGDAVLLNPGTYDAGLLGIQGTYDFPVEFIGVNGAREEIILQSVVDDGSLCPADWFLRVVTTPPQNASRESAVFALRHLSICHRYGAEGCLFLTPGVRDLPFAPTEPSANGPALTILEDVDLTSLDKATPLVSCGPGCHVVALGTHLHDAGAAGFKIGPNSALQLEDCQIIRCGQGGDGLVEPGEDAAILLHRSADLVLKKCQFRNNGGFALQLKENLEPLKLDGLNSSQRRTHERLTELVGFSLEQLAQQSHDWNRDGNRVFEEITCSGNAASLGDQERSMAGSSTNIQPWHLPDSAMGRLLNERDATFPC